MELARYFSQAQGDNTVMITTKLGKMSTASLGALLTLFAFGSGSAGAAPVFYFDEASFLNAASGAGLSLSTEGFVSAVDAGNTINFATGSVSSAGGPNLDTRATDGDASAIGWTGSSGVNPLTWSLNRMTNAFGIDVQDCCEFSPFEINMLVNGVSNRFGFTSAQSELNLQFIGVIDTAQAFSTVSMSAPNGDFQIFDRLQTSEAVPVPATLGLLGLGLFGFGCARRRS